MTIDIRGINNLIVFKIDGHLHAIAAIGCGPFIKPDALATAVILCSANHEGVICLRHGDAVVLCNDEAGGKFRPFHSCFIEAINTAVITEIDFIGQRMISDETIIGVHFGMHARVIPVRKLIPIKTTIQRLMCHHESAINSVGVLGRCKEDAVIRHHIHEVHIHSAIIRCVIICIAVNT